MSASRQEVKGESAAHRVHTAFGEGTEVQTNWPSIVKRITEAARFQTDFTAILSMGE